MDLGRKNNTHSCYKDPPYPHLGNFIGLDPLSVWETFHSQQQMKTSTGASEHQTTWRPLVDGFLCTDQQFVLQLQLFKVY